MKKISVRQQQILDEGKKHSHFFTLHNALCKMFGSRYSREVLRTTIEYLEKNGYQVLAKEESKV